MEYNGTAFKLTDTFMGKYKRKQPDWGPLGYFSFKRTYARQLPNGKTEEWWQTVQRVTEGCFLSQKLHCENNKVLWNERQAQRSAQEMFKLIWDFKFLPPGRGLWSMGTDFAFEKGGACLNNCGFTSTKDIDKDFSAPFVWLMDMSLLGVGVGFDTSGRDKEVYLRKPRTTKETYVVEDSREGWVDAFRRTLDAYSGSDSMPESFDFSQIRSAGEPIKRFGGIAPGPDPLIKLIERTKKVLSRYVEADQPVDTTLIVDLMNFAGAAVVAGGIRRTAEIAFGTIDDEEFKHLKEPEYIKDPELARWASNNSFIVDVGDTYRELAAQSAVNGEPGFFWLDNAREYGRMSDGRNNRDRRAMGCNPCGEQTLEDRELCNLVETFPARHADIDEYLRTLKFAYLYAKTVTLIPTHDPRTNAVMLRNRRIGVSQTGIVENVNKLGFREHINWCELGYQEIQSWDQVYSDWLCIPRSIKTTTVKPSGTVSLLPGSTPGIHFPHSEYYTRRIQVSKNSHLWETMKEAGYHVEQSVYADDTMTVSFPVHEPNFKRRKDEVSIWEQFELAAAMQAKWSDNQVSITITVKPEEAKDLPRALAMYEKRLKAVSFLPLTDHQYEQAPYEEIDQEEYEKMVSKIKKVKINLDLDEQELERFCDGDACIMPGIEEV